MTRLSCPVRARHAAAQGLGRAFDKVVGPLEAEAGCLAHALDDRPDAELRRAVSDPTEARPNRGAPGRLACAGSGAG
jgi:hypothetical protein